MRKVPFVLAIAMLSSPALSGEEELHGTWKLANMQRKIVETGQTLDAFGPNPRGFLMYGEAGRMNPVIVRDEDAELLLRCARHQGAIRSRPLI